MRTEQPPSGGCVLKLGRSKAGTLSLSQPPSGGCVLKQTSPNFSGEVKGQPPSGGCVLKLIVGVCFYLVINAATFGWLCVETSMDCLEIKTIAKQPPSGGCVLKQIFCFLKFFC